MKNLVLLIIFLFSCLTFALEMYEIIPIELEVMSAQNSEIQKVNFEVEYRGRCEAGHDMFCAKGTKRNHMIPIGGKLGYVEMFQLAGVQQTAAALCKHLKYEYGRPTDIGLRPGIRYLKAVYWEPKLSRWMISSQRGYSLLCFECDPK